MVVNPLDNKLDDNVLVRDTAGPRTILVLQQFYLSIAAAAATITFDGGTTQPESATVLGPVPAAR
jgi:hypothetical protein